jgi:hypothetical protein
MPFIAAESPENSFFMASGCSCANAHQLLAVFKSVVGSHGAGLGRSIICPLNLNIVHARSRGIGK